MVLFVPLVEPEHENGIITWERLFCPLTSEGKLAIVMQPTQLAVSHCHAKPQEDQTVQKFVPLVNRCNEALRKLESDQFFPAFGPISAREALPKLLSLKAPSIYRGWRHGVSMRESDREFVPQNTPLFPQITILSSWRVFTSCSFPLSQNLDFADSLELCAAAPTR